MKKKLGQLRKESESQPVDQIIVRRLDSEVREIQSNQRSSLNVSKLELEKKSSFLKVKVENSN